MILIYISWLSLNGSSELIYISYFPFHFFASLFGPFFIRWKSSKGLLGPKKVPTEKLKVNLLNLQGFKPKTQLNPTQFQFTQQKAQFLVYLGPILKESSSISDKSKLIKYTKFIFLTIFFHMVHVDQRQPTTFTTFRQWNWTCVKPTSVQEVTPSTLAFPRACIGGDLLALVSAC